MDEIIKAFEHQVRRSQPFSSLLRQRTEVLWHPDSPGMRVTVTRTWIGRLFKPKEFATLGESC